MNDDRYQERDALVLRIFWMVIFLVVWQLAEVILGGVVLLQLGIRLIKGAANEKLCIFGASLSLYLAQIGRFGTFVTEEKPWPFADWPQAEPEPESVQDEVSST